MSNYFDNKDLFVGPKTNQYGGHMVMTNVHKERKTKYWNIDTRFRDDYDNYSQTNTGGLIPSYIFTLPESINDVKNISVCNIEIPISFFNISAALGNNSMKVGNALIVIPDGFYNSTTFKAALNTQLTGSSLTFDISLNGHTLFNNTSGSSITIQFSIKPSNTCLTVTNKSGTTSADFDKYNIKSKLGWLLGFRNISYTIPGNSTLNSESLLDLSTPRYIYLIIDEFINSNPNSFISPLPTSIINKNIIAKISMDYYHYPFGNIIVGNFTNGYLISDVRSYSGKVNIQKLKIQLVNEYGNPIHLNGLDFSFCLEINYE
jgi:hypothetical protein